MRMSNNGSAKSRAGVYRDLDSGTSEVRGVPAEETTVSEVNASLPDRGVPAVSAVRKKEKQTN